MAKLKVHTAQNVLLEYPIANVGQRLLIGFIDTIVLVVYFFAAIFLILNSFNFIDRMEDVGVLQYCLIILPLFFYEVVCEYFLGGKTVGKLLTKTRVVKIDGGNPSLSDYMLRWLLRVIDTKLGFIFLFFLPKSIETDAQEMFAAFVVTGMAIPIPLVGLMSMLFTKNTQRLGDIVANTTVITQVRSFSLNQTILKLTKKDYEPRFLNVLRLSDKDFYTIKKTIENAKYSKNYDSVKRLAAKAKEILEIETDLSPMEMLEVIIADYNYLSREKDG